MSVPVLLVDDNDAKRLALKSVLLPLGYSIFEAESGVAALRCVMAQEFAVILLDVCMPVMDGFETAALIRQRRQSELTPIIFITAFGSDEIVTTDLYAEGAVDFIFAPVPPDELRAKVAVFADLFTEAERLASEARIAQSSADHLRLLTDAAPIGIFQTDAEERYVYTNPMFTTITGIPSDVALGRKWGETVFPRTPKGVAVSLADTDVDLLVGKRVELEIPGAIPKIVVATSRVIPDGHGGIAGRVGTLADVTLEAGAEAVVADARDRATEASRLKSDFLANMSHEIRTPMNGVIGMTDLLLETELDLRQRDYAQTVRNSGEALLTIINDILDFSKVEAGKLEIEDIEFNVQSIINDVVNLLAGSAQAKGLELIVIVANSVPTVVSGDPGRVRQVLTNLVGNSIKFTQAGEIVLRVTACEVLGADAVVRFEVTDTGDGIAPDKVHLVFQPFVQADTSTSRKYGGTGLGLAISAQLVALMGGECGVSSVLGAGSDFWFTIGVHADAAQVSDTPLPDPDLAGLRVLVVDDNDTQRAILSEYLAGWGMTVTPVVSGHDALAAMRTAATRGEPFAVALLDRSMPGMNGVQLRDAIVEDAFLTARLVLMIGLGEEQELGTAAETGVCALLSKPIDHEALRVCLRQMLGFTTAEVIALDGTRQWSAASSETRTGRLLLAEDNLINQKVAVAMLSGAGYRVDTVLDGKAAVAAAADHSYDAILMDCQMPELNGYEATAAIRAHEGLGRHTPIIAMTAGARREDRERCLAEGMDSYVSKPVSKEALLTLVAWSVSDGSASPGTISIATHASAGEITIDPAVLEELRILGEGSEQDFLGGLIDQFFVETERRLVELRDAVLAGDAAAVGELAHGIKGSGGQLGGRRLALSCGRLERKAGAGHLTDAHIHVQEVEFDYLELRQALTQQLPSRNLQRLSRPS